MNRKLLSNVSRDQRRVTVVTTKVHSGTHLFLQKKNLLHGDRARSQIEKSRLNISGYFFKSTYLFFKFFFIFLQCIFPCLPQRRFRVVQYLCIATRLQLSSAYCKYGKIVQHTLKHQLAIFSIPSKVTIINYIDDYTTSTTSKQQGEQIMSIPNSAVYCCCPI